MSDIEEQAAARVAKAERINAEVLTRLHQYDVKAAPKAKAPKAADKP